MTRWAVRPIDVVLRTVPAEHHDDAERLVRDDPSFRAEVQRLRAIGDAVTLLPAQAWSSEEPPALDTDAAFAIRPPVAVGPAARWRRRAADRLVGTGGRGALVLRPAVALAAAAALVAGGVLAGSALDDRGAPQVAAGKPAPPAGGRLVGLRAFEGKGTQRAAVRLPDAAGGAVDLRVAGARPTREGQFYEVWLLGDGERLTSVGTFRVGRDGVARGRFSIGVDPATYRYVDVSLEQDDGDPTHSRRSVLRSAALS